MNKLIIPTILTATILVAGIFAFIPVQEASTVHVSIVADIAAAGGGEAAAIDFVAQAGGTNIDATAVNVLINVAEIAAEEHFEGRLLLQVTDQADGDATDVTVLVQTWDGAEWLTIDTIIAPDDDNAFTIIEVVGESTLGGVEIRLVFDEGASTTSSLFDAQGIITGT